MNGLNMAAVYVVQTLGSLYLLIVLLRFILQLVRADFYNPLSQFIVRATQPLLKPTRRVIPGFAGVDVASLILAVLVQLAILALIIKLMAYTLSPLLQLLVWSLVGVTGLFLKAFLFALIIGVLLSWAAMYSHHPAALMVTQICEPVLAPFRRFLPAMGWLDLSPILDFIALSLLDMLLITNQAMA